jgi:crotonobetainyl-CoA:carnitine CoA-transferase CaiB-like acyl-CoA transferase
VAAVLAGVHHRDRTGHAPSASTSLLHALVTLDMTSGHGHRIHTPDTSGKVYGVMPLAFMTARCKDGQYLQMCSRVPRLFRNWFRVLGLEHLYDDPAYQQMPDVFPSQQALDDVIATVRERMAGKTRDEWLEVFGANDVGANPFLTPPEFLTCEQALVTGSVVEVDDPGHGRLRQVGPLVQLSDTPGGPRAGAPAPGADVRGAHRRSTSPTRSPTSSWWRAPPPTPPRRRPPSSPRWGPG